MKNLSTRKIRPLLLLILPLILDHDEMGNPAIGPEAAIHMMEGAYKIWPDLHLSVEDIIAEDYKVIVRNIWTGTMASGMKIEFYGFVLLKNKRRQNC